MRYALIIALLLVPLTGLAQTDTPTETPTETPTVTPTETPTVTPTVTPTGAVCTDFPSTAANTQDAFELGGAYPPGPPVLFDGPDQFLAQRGFQGGGYIVSVGLLRWNTSSLGAVSVASAELVYLGVGILNDDNLDFTAGYYTWSLPPVSGDYTEGVDTGAFDVPLASLNPAGGTVPFADVSGIDTHGFTSIRVTISQLPGDAAPPGNNDFNSASPLTLRVCVVPPYTPTPTVLLTATPTSTPTITPPPTINITQQYPRERVEFPLLVNGTPVPDTAAFGIDFASGITCTSVAEPVQGRTKLRLRCTVP